MQETCLRLMGKKMLVALMMEGKFSGEGLQALDADEDLMSAMARELVEKAGIGESADAIWRELDNERDKLQPHSVADSTAAEPLGECMEAAPKTPAVPLAGIHLVEASSQKGTRAKVNLWPTTSKSATQLKLFG